MSLSEPAEPAELSEGPQKTVARATTKLPGIVLVCQFVIIFLLKMAPVIRPSMV